MDSYEYLEDLYLPEFDVANRVTFEDGDTLEIIAADAGVRPDLRKKGERFTSKTWRFYVYVNAAARKLIDERIVSTVGSREIPIILRHIKFIDNPQYKNPDAYIAGYAVSKTGKIDGKLVRAISGASDGTIKAEDIIRYARLWIQTKRNPPRRT